MAHLAWAPARGVSDVARTWLENPINPLSYTAAGRNLVASAKIFERLTRRYDKPAFDLATTAVDGKIVPLVERVVWQRPFCKLLHFETQFDAGASEPRQKLLIVARLSGHHATLLRGTVEAFLPFYDVYITDWADARTVPLGRRRAQAPQASISRVKYGLWRGHTRRRARARDRALTAPARALKIVETG